MSTTACTATVTAATKKIALSATISVRESVALTLTGFTGHTAADLRCAIIDPVTEDLLANCDAFTASGSDYAGTIDLNTTELVAKFSGRSPLFRHRLSMIVWDVVLDSLIGNDLIFVQNNPYTEDADLPTSIYGNLRKISGIIHIQGTNDTTLWYPLTIQGDPTTPYLAIGEGVTI